MRRPGRKAERAGANESRGALAASAAFANKVPEKQDRCTPAGVRADLTAMYQGLQSAAFDLS